MKDLQIMGNKGSRMNRNGLALILSIGILICTNSIYGQTNLDSLYQEAQKETEAKPKLSKELTYLNSLVVYHPDSAIAVLDSLIEGYKNQNFPFAEARCLSLQSWFLSYKAQYEEGHKIGHLALEIQKRENVDTMGIGLTLNRIAIANLQFGRLVEAEKYMKEALDYFKLLDNLELIDLVYNNLGIVATETKDFELGIKYYSQSLALRKKMGSGFWIAYSYFNIAALHLESNSLDSAEKYYALSVRTFKENTKKGTVPPMVLSGLGSLKEAQGLYAEAVINFKESLKGSEERKHTEMVVQTGALLAEALYKNGDFKEAFEALKNNQIQLFRLDSVNDVSKVSEIEEKYQNAEKEMEIIRLKSEELESRNKAQKSNILALAFGGLLLIGLLIAGIFIRRRKQKDRLKEIELNRQISDMKLVALRSQMNPHFIFNCINTAQNFVLDSDKEAAYDFLAKFAKLLRIVLENSDQTFVSLEDELSHLKLYIELEQIRFEKKFDFILEVDPELENGVFEMPSMMIQPFVENSISHGLMNKKEGNRSLKIELKKEGEMMFCLIEDNGVGREKALEIKQEKKKYYKSTALPNIQERLAIIEKNTGFSIDLNIEDLFEASTASGTRINIRLPLS